MRKKERMYFHILTLPIWVVERIHVDLDFHLLPLLHIIMTDILLLKILPQNVNMCHEEKINEMPFFNRLISPDVPTTLPPIESSLA